MVNPHGHGKRLTPRLLTGEALQEERRRAGTLKQIRMSSRETSDLIMLGTGAFTPLEGFMTYADWRGVCDDYRMADGVFWPIPITLSTTKEDAGRIKEGDEIALIDGETAELMGSMAVRQKYAIDKGHECSREFRSTDPNHPGVAGVMA